MFGIGKFGLVFGALSLAATSAFALPKATEIYPDMGLGYNIGNTMEVPGNQGGPTGWGNPFPDAAYVKAIKDAGFNTVRIPCAWVSKMVLPKVMGLAARTRKLSHWLVRNI